MEKASYKVYKWLFNLLKKNRKITLVETITFTSKKKKKIRQIKELKKDNECNLFFTLVVDSPKKQATQHIHRKQ